MNDLSAEALLLAAAVAMLAGLVKGIVGMPMIMISGFGIVAAPDQALAWLILPTLVSNLVQALRQGVGAALASLHRFRRFLLAGFVLMVVSAQLVRLIPPSALLLLIGLPITIHAGMMLAGLPLRLPRPPGPRAEIAAGVTAGFFGGISGIWGPPTVALLTALDTCKTDQMRIQGVVYGAGSFVLLGAHLASGVLNSATLPVSALLVVPALLGARLGLRAHDRLDQILFRRLTLFVLMLAGLNLLRRGVLAF